MANYRIDVEINPGKAKSGRQAVSGELSALEQQARRLKTVMDGALAFAGLAAATVSLQRAVEEAKAFATSMALIETQIDKTVFSMEELNAAAREQAKIYGSTANQQALALYDIISAGATDAKTATDLLNESNRLAVAGMSDVAVVADGMTSIMNSYGKAAGSAAEVSNTMFLAVKFGKTTVEELSASMGKVTPLAASLGVSFKELSAATAALTKGGISTSESISGLRAVLAAVAKPSGEAAELSKKLGLDFTSAGLQAKGFAGFMKEVVDKTKGSQDAMAILFGGVEALVPVLALAGNASKDMAEALKAMGVDVTALEKALAIMQKGPAQQFNILTANITDKLIVLGNAILTVVLPAVQFLNDNFDTIVDLITAATVAFVAYKVAVMTVTAATVAWGAVQTLMAGQFGVWIGLIGTASARLGFLAAAQVAATSASVGLVAGIRALTVALLGNPVTAIAVGVASLAAGYYFLSTRAGEATKAQKALEQTNRTLDAVTADVTEQTAKLATATGKAREEALKIIQTRMAQARATLAAASAESVLAAAMAHRAEQEVKAASKGPQGFWEQFAEGAAASQGVSLTVERFNQASAASEKASKHAEVMGERFRTALIRLGELDKQIEDAQKPLDNMAGSMLNLGDETAKAGAKAADASEAFRDFIKQLNQDTAALGKTTLEAKELEIIAKSAEASAAGFGVLAQSIMDAGAAYILAAKAQDSADFIKSLKEETAAIGKSEKAIRAIAVAKAIEAAATDKDKKAIQEAADARENAIDKDAEERFRRSVLLPLSQEVDLLGRVGTARDRMALAMEEEEFRLRAKAAGVIDINKAWLTYLELQTKIIDHQEQIDDANALADAYESVAERASDAANTMRDAFGSVGGAIGDLISNLADYEAAQKQVAAEIASGRRTQKEGEVELSRLQSKHIGDQIAGVKSLFKEKSAGYKIMTTIEKVYAALQLANTIKSIAMDTTQTGTSVANSLTRATADQAAGASKIFSQLGVWAFPVVAAMVAILASLGVRGGGGGGSGPAIPSAEQMQESLGTGTVLGDPTAKSESLGHAFDIMIENSNEELEYSNDMVRYLRSIDAGIGNLTGQVSRQIGLGGGIFDTSGFNLGSKGSGGVLGIGAKSTTRTLWDQGIEILQTTVDEVLNEGINAQVYSVIQQVKKKSGFFGLGGGTKTSYENVTGDVPSQIEEQFRLIVGDLSASVVSFASQLGVDVSEQIKSMKIEGAKLSFQDMNGEEIEEALQAYFSSVADQLSSVVESLGSINLSEMQQAGEGLYETLARVVRTMMTVKSSLSSIGQSLDAVGGNYGANVVAPAQVDLVGQFGGLDEFQEAISNFAGDFLTKAEQMAPVIAAVATEMDRLGYASVTTNDQFKELVKGIDLSTEGGRELFAQLLSVAPAFAKVNEYLAEVNKTADTTKENAATERDRRSLEIQILELTGKAEEALAAKRADQLAGLDESNRVLQLQVWALTDAAEAQRVLDKATEDAATTARDAAAALATLNAKRRDLEIELMEATGDATGALAARREIELAGLDESLHVLQKQIWAAEDATAANQALADAQQIAADAAAAAAAIVQEGRDLEIRLLEAQGKSVEALTMRREDELAAVNEVNRAALLAVHAAEDAATAQTVLNEANEAAAAIASQRADMEIELMEATGNAAGALIARRQQELAALDESLRPLQESIWSAEDAAIAQQALADAQEAAAATASARRDLEIELMEAEGNASGALAARRQIELAAMEESLRPLQESIWLIQDRTAAEAAEAKTLAEAAAAAAAIQKSRSSLEIELMKATGKAAEALDAQRRLELMSMDSSLWTLQQNVWAAQDADAAAKELAATQKQQADTAREAAQAEASLLKTRQGMEAQLMDLQGNASGALALRRQIELAAMDESLHGLQGLIWSYEDAATAADKLAEAERTAKETADKAAADALARERDQQGMLAELYDAQGRSADALIIRRRLELDAMDEALQPMQELIWGYQDAAAAAKAASDLLRQRQGLEIELMQATGREAEAVAVQRAAELIVLDESLRALQQQVWAAQDAAAANAELARQQEIAAEAASRAAEEAARYAEELAKQRRELQIQLVEALGNAEGALAMRRADQLAAMDASLRSLQRQVWAAQDAAEAQEKYREAIGRQASALRSLMSEYEATVNTFGKLAESLREYRKELLTPAGNTRAGYKALLSTFQQTARLAASGDEKALGSLQATGNQFLEASRANAASSLDYQRDVAMVVRAVGAGIGAADQQVTVAERQLALLEAQVNYLERIANNTANTANPPVSTATLASSGSATYQTGTTSAVSFDEVVQELRNVKAELKTANARILKVQESTKDSANRLASWDGGDHVRTPGFTADTPNYTADA